MLQIFNVIANENVHYKCKELECIPPPLCTSTVNCILLVIKLLLHSRGRSFHKYKMPWLCLLHIFYTCNQVEKQIRNRGNIMKIKMSPIKDGLQMLIVWEMTVMNTTLLKSLFSVKPVPEDWPSSGESKNDEDEKQQRSSPSVKEGKDKDKERDPECKYDVIYSTP